MTAAADYTKPQAWLASPRNARERALCVKLASLERERLMAERLARFAEASGDSFAARSYWQAAARCEARQDKLGFDL